MMKKAKGQESTAANDNVLDNHIPQASQQEPIKDSALPRKQKRRPKIAKPVVHDQVENGVQIEPIVANVPSNNVEDIKLNAVARSASRKALIGQAAKHEPIATETPKPNLLHCNTVTLTLSDSINCKPEEINQHPSRARGRRQKILETKDSVRSDSKVELQDEMNVNVDATKAALGETDYSTPVYQKLLNFNSKPPDETCAVKDDIKIEEETSVRKSNWHENCNDFDNLPLTGDPDIDEEIIAFYKAKRSGGAY